MALAIVQSNSGNTGAASTPSTNATLSTGATAGNVLVMAVSADAYFASPPAGWTLNANSKNETFFGQYVYTKIASNGETTWALAPGASAAMSWVVIEVSGAAGSYFDGAVAGFVQSSATTHTSGTLTPTAGQRLLIAAFAGSLNGIALRGVQGWTNSFTELQDTWTVKASGDNNNASVATFLVTANGSTGYSTSGTWENGATPQARGAILLSIAATAGANVAPTADAGPDQTVTAGASVTLDGSGSSDVDGTIASYDWLQVAGPAVTLSNSTVVGPTFTAPGTGGTVVFRLIVTDDDGEPSAEDLVAITVSGFSLVASKKIRIGGAWQDKPLKVRKSGSWL